MSCAREQCRKKMLQYPELGYSAEDNGFKVAGLVILIILITYQVIGKMIIVRHVALRKQKYSRGIF